jgi:YD repeat-containing protein
VVVASGSFQSEMGCSADNDPTCMRSWLQDPDNDGVFSLSTTQIPAGAYQASAAGSATVAFTVPSGAVTTFSYDSASHLLSVSTAQPGAKPDLSVAAAYWIDNRTIAYPADRLPAGVDPAWLRFRLHWGALAVDATGLGGT